MALTITCCESSEGKKKKNLKSSFTLDEYESKPIVRRYKWAHTATLEQVKHAQGRACVIQPGRACVSLCVEAKGYSRAIFLSSFYKPLGDRIGGEKDGGLKEAKGGKIVIMLTQLTVRCAAVKLFTQQISGRA